VDLGSDPEAWPAKLAALSDDGWALNAVSGTHAILERSKIS